MKTKIVFHDLKMEIPTETGEVAHFYGELMYVVYDRPYCWLHFTGNARYKIEASLKYLMDNLPQDAYIQCSRSVIFNICYYREYRKDPPVVIMDDGMAFNLSRRNVMDFKRQKNSLSRISPPCPGCYACMDEKCTGQAVFCRRKKARQNDGQVIDDRRLNIEH